MTVSASNMGILPFSVQPANTVHSRQDQNESKAKGDQGFGAILSEISDDDFSDRTQPARVHDMPPLQQAFFALDQGVAIGSGNAAYTLQVDIGDAALAFQAMPLVGPVAVTPESDTNLTAILDQTAAAQSAVAKSTGEAAATEPSLAAKMPDADSAFVIRPTDGRVENKVQIAASRVANVIPQAPNVVRASQSASTQSMTQAPQSRQGLEQAMRAQQGSENARSTQTMQLFAAKSQLFAQLVTAASEYRVSVRGTQLTATERDQLMADIRAALRSHGLADLPISLTANSGAA